MTRTGVLACLVLGALLAGCDEGGAPPAVPPLHTAPAPATTDSGLRVGVEVPRAEVTLGDEIVLRVTLANTGDTPLTVSIPRLDRYCTTVRVRVGSGTPYKVEHLYADLTKSTLQGLSFAAPNAKELPPGGELTGDIALTATQPGEHHITLSYLRTMNADAVTPDPVTVLVKPDGEKTHLGAEIATSLGTITVRLRPDLAPVTVDSFATLTRNRFFDGLAFHRILAGFMAQGGDPKGDGSGGPGYFLPLEAKQDLLHRRGVLSMARTQLKDTAGSQFFLMFATRPDLDPGFRGGDGYTTFGEMVQGESTLAKLEAVETRLPPGGREKSVPVERVEIQSIRLVTLE